MINILKIASNLFDNVTLYKFIILNENLSKKGYIDEKMYKRIQNLLIKFINEIDCINDKDGLLLAKKIHKENTIFSSKDLLRAKLKYIGNINKKDYETLNTIDIDLTKKKLYSLIEKNIKNNITSMTKEFIEFLDKNGIKKESFLLKLSDIHLAKFIKDNLSEKLLNQKFAIEKISDSFKNNLEINKKPIKHSFLFIGPPATGKTYTAKLLAEFLGYKLFTINLANYPDEREATFVLFGIDSRWSNQRAGDLTLFLKNNPKSIILFDEFEKAPVTVQYALLSIFNEGKIRDKTGFVYQNDQYVSFNMQDQKHKELLSEGKVEYDVDCKDAIFIFTSNLGKELYNSETFWKLVENDYTKAENRIIETLRNEKTVDISTKQQRSAILPELLSRLLTGDLVLYKHLKFEHLKKIGTKIFNEYIKKFKDVYEVEIDIKYLEELLSILILNLGPKIDVRKLQSKIAVRLFDEITDFLRETPNNLFKLQRIYIDISKKALDYYKKNIKSDKDILKNVFRKNLELNIKYELTYKNSILNVTIDEISFSKVENIADFDTILFDIPNVSFNDIAGHNKIKQKLKQIIKLLKKSSKDTPKGMLLYGPPGTGKTMLAKAVAYESELPFIQTNGTELQDLDRMKKIFDTAKDYAPCIIFIDEIDALGNRDNQLNTIIINELLTQLSGFNEDLGVFVIAATNNKEKLDSALLRSGRIDLHFEIPFLDKDAREFFIKKIINEFNLDISNTDINKIVSFTSNMSGADLEKVRRELKIKKELNIIKNITVDEIIDEINCVKYGEALEKEKVEHILESTAIHEVAHALISKILFPERKIEQVTIMPRRKSLGFVSFEEEEKINNITKEDLFNKICIALAGRIAQIKKYGKEGIDTGASSDIEQATFYAYEIINYGMDENYLNISIDFLKKIGIEADIIDNIKKIINEATEKTNILIEENFDKILKLSQILLEKEVIDDDEITKIYKEKGE